jgi:hypothetical protein
MALARSTYAPEGRYLILLTNPGTNFVLRALTASIAQLLPAAFTAKCMLSADDTTRNSCRDNNQWQFKMEI